jgi:lipopolysaccharide transport system permease protein
MKIDLPISRMRFGLSPSKGSESIAKTVRIIHQHRELLKEMTNRILHVAHAQHGFGGIWIYINPLVVVGTYLLIFGFVLGTRIQNAGEFPGDYPSYVLTGLVPWLMMQAVLTRSPMALTSNASLVKQIVFPIEILPIATAAAAVIPYLPALGLVIIYKALVGGLPWTIVLLPVAGLLVAMMAIGLAFALAAITAFIRDVGDVVQSICTIALYLMPIVYLPGWVPGPLRPLMYVIPFSYPAWVMQDVLFFGYIAHPVAWLVTLVFAIVLLAVGFRTFENLKPYFGNVL